MKCIEDEIPFELPEGWEWTRLASVLSLSSGKSLKVRQLTSEEEFPVYGGNGINGTHSDYNVDSETIIIGRVGYYCGSVYKTSSKAWVTDNALIATIKEQNVFDIDFLVAILKYLDLGKTSVSTAQPVVSGKGILPLIVPVPPKDEQNRINKSYSEIMPVIALIENDKEEVLALVSKTKSKILDLAIRGQLVPQDPNDEPASVLLERIRAEKEELIKQGKIKRDKKESIIFKGEDNSYYETISNNTICIDEEVPFDLPDGWIWCRLKSLAAPHENSFVDGPFGSNLKTDHYTNSREVRIIQLNNIGEFTWKNNGIKYTTYSHAETLARCKSYPGDIVIAKMMPAGRAILIPDIEDVYVISSDCVRLQLPNYIDKKYVMYMINSPTINKSVMENVQGIGRTRTSLSKLKELLVPIPPYKQQCQISDTFDKSLFYFDTINALCE